MIALGQALDDYLTLRRALGFALRSYEPPLRDFVAFLARAGTETITTRHPLAWADAAHGVPSAALGAAPRDGARLRRLSPGDRSGDRSPAGRCAPVPRPAAHPSPLY